MEHISLAEAKVISRTTFSLYPAVSLSVI